MTIDFSAAPDDSPTNAESDTPMFAPVPAWERGKKRRGFGGRNARREAGRVAEEPRTFAAEPEDEPLAGDQRAYAFDPIEPATTAAPTESAFAATPAYATSTARGKTNTTPILVAAGIILVGGLGAAGWYLAQTQGNAGVAELTPGSTGVAATTTTTTSAVTPPTQTAENATPQAALPGTTAPAAAAPVTHHATTTTTTTHQPTASRTTQTQRTLTARARPASRAAEDVGANASATLPSAPQPYQGAAAPAPAPTAPPVLNVPPLAAAPAPTPAPPASTATPAPIQSIPPANATTPPPAAATPPTQTPPPQ